MVSQFPPNNSFGANAGKPQAGNSNSNTDSQDNLPGPAPGASGNGMPGGIVDWNYFFSLIGGDAYWGTFGINPWDMLGNLNGDMGPMTDTIRREFHI